MMGLDNLIIAVPEHQELSDLEITKIRPFGRYGRMVDYMLYSR